MNKVWLGFLAVAVAALQPFAAAQWDESHLNAARGQAVYWNAWGGDERINAYIDWVATQVDSLYGIELQHVKLSNTADAVARVRTEVAAGRIRDGGSVDLIWINGENFAVMKREGLLFGPFAFDLPNFSLVDTAAQPTTILDFTIPTDGYESPWGSAQFNLMVNTEFVPDTFRDISALARWTAANPGRFTYPRPPDFLGSTFLKQVLLETVDADFNQMFAGDSDQLAPVFSFLDALHPTLWRQGRSFPRSGPALRDMLANFEVDIALSFNPFEAASLVRNGDVPSAVRATGFRSGTIANSHFVAIPINSNSKAAAMLVADFLLSPIAQARKTNLLYWGDPSVIEYDRLSVDQRALFNENIRLSTDLGPTLSEPHPSWMEALEAEWEVRYGS